MSERHPFESEADARVAALFDAVPADLDADAFAARVEGRLGRRRRLRRTLLSAAALAGGGLAVAQVASEGLAVRLAQLGHGGFAWIQAEPKAFLDAAGKAFQPVSVSLSALPLHGLVAPGQLVWLAVAGGAAAIVTGLQAREPA